MSADSESGVQPSVFEMVGGMRTFERLADRLYAGIERDPLLRPMFPKSLHCARRIMALFLAQFFGGPPEYSVLRGHPRLRMRHSPFRIGPAERDAWLSHMLAAIDDVGIEEPMRTAMRAHFEQAATFLINQADETPGA